MGSKRKYNKENKKKNNKNKKREEKTMKKENEEREKRKKEKKKSDLHYLSLSRVKYGQINISKHLQLKATCKEHTEPRLLIICNMEKVRYV